MNYNGDTCPTTCTGSNLTCDNSLTCVDRQKTSCQFGLYYSKSGECVYSCPDSSCICSSDLKCECNLGYKKISDNPPACIILRCASYRILNDRYICDTMKKGYKLNTAGRCCDCEIGYAAQDTNPVICISNRCTSYDIVNYNYNYICHATESGYQLDSLGNCCICDEGYDLIETDPLICVSNRCMHYYVENNQAICDLPHIGYQLDILGKCCICDDGYRAVEMRPLFCISSRCLTYHKENDRYICDSIQEGYKLDSEGKCCTCKEEYTAVAIHPLVCIKIDHCIIYIYNGSKYICTQCNDRYTIDEQGTCSLCSSGYEAASQNPLVCVSKVENCYEYRYEYLLEEWVCDKCVEGYMIDSYNRCDECESGYLKYDLECKNEIRNCIEYNEGEAGCRICSEGYELDRNNECTVCSLGYIEISKDSECALEILNCLDYIYSPEFFNWKCQECKAGYQLDSNGTCNLCAEGYKLEPSSSSLLCIKDDSSSPNYNIPTQNISQTYGAEIEYTSSISTLVTQVSVAISSAASSDSSVLLFYLNTIKLLSYIKKLNIEYPFEIRKQQSTCEKYLSRMNLFSCINLKGHTIQENMANIMNDTHSFILSSIYNIMLLFVLFIGHAICYLITKYFTGKFKALGDIGLRYYKYDIYIQFYMLSFLDLFYQAINKIANVIYNQPNESSMIYILDYILALLYIVILIQIFTVLIIHILAHGIIRKKQGLRNKRFKQIYQYLEKDYKPSIASIYYHVIFLVRRSCIAISITFFRNNLYLQSISCFLACVGVLAHMITFKPLKDRVYNVCMTLIELCITVCFSATIGFVSSGIYEEILMWGMLGSIYFSYLLHCFISYYKIMKLICPIVNRWIQKIRQGVSSI